MAYHADNALPSHSEGERVLPMQKGGKQRLKKSDIWVTGSFDVPFLALSLLLLTIGLVMLFSASYAYAFYNDDGNSYAYISRQLIFAVVGLVAMFILSKLNYKVIQAATVPLLLVTLALLCLVLVYHTNLRGFRRWIPLGPITFQPSDLAKFTISVVLANYISRYYHQMRKFKYGFVYPILVIAVFCGLIYLEHHMSCTILIFLIGASLMWAGGSNWKLFAIGVGIVAAVAVLVVVNPELLENYAGERIRAWLDKSYSPDDLRWQTNNSLYAIGSGGLFGTGLGNSKQKYLYVSEPQNDFIFSIVCEELGFVGAAFIILLFGLLVWRGVDIAKKCPNRFGSLLVLGIMAQIGFQVVLNIMVVTDTIPNTGIALPFFSYGGTALILLLGEIGVVLSGRVIIEMGDVWGNNSVLSSIGPGGVFAEVYACVPGEPLMVNVTAAEDTRALLLNIRRVLEPCANVCPRHVRLVRNLLTLCSEKNLQLSRRVLHTGPKSIRKRLLSYFSECIKRTGSYSFDIPYNRQQLADYLSVERSALSNELSLMQRDGLIRYEKNHFDVMEQIETQHL